VTLFDEVGIDVATKIGKVMLRHFGHRMDLPPATDKMVADGRLGRKSKKGFYTYGKGKKRVDKSVYGLIPGGTDRRPVVKKDVQDRLVFAFLNEAVRCLQDGILRSPRDGDVGAIFGLGFPPFLGGPFRHLDRIGAKAAVATLERLREQHGQRFEPAAMLNEMAREGRSFHAA
jgi:3-hydroxyacyl-CoA dehydrogenase/enoyl-CoA hydratase/3-hydroxybutyryl-CoA epimerase